MDPFEVMMIKYHNLMGFFRQPASFSDLLGPDAFGEVVNLVCEAHNVIIRAFEAEWQSRLEIVP